MLNAQGRILDLIKRLEGGQAQAPSNVPKPAQNLHLFAQLRTDLRALWDLEPHIRGNKFEIFLKGAFDLHGMEARDSFRLKGEQIDGSFQLAGETYLLEAKWQATPTPAADLRIFEDKLSQKAAWVRGLFVSYNGFTAEGLHAFGGTGRRTVCMNGQDFDEVLERQLPLDDVIKLKVRRAAETGEPFASVRELFP